MDSCTSVQSEKQTHPGFEIGSSIPVFMITIMLSAPLIEYKIKIAIKDDLTTENQEKRENQ